MAYVPILTYHRVTAERPTHTTDPRRISVSAAQFRAHLTMLRRFGYRTVTLENYGAILRRDERFPSRHVALTFDDGYEDNFSIAFPILKEFGFNATIFAVPGQTHNRWDDGEAPLMNAGHMREMEKSGIAFGAHTCHHVHLTQTESAQAREEIVESKKRLEDALDHPVRSFAYPYGESNETTETLVREAGFESGFATDRAPRDHRENLYRIRRIVVFPKTTAWQILWKIQPWFPKYQDFRRHVVEPASRSIGESENKLRSDL